MRGTIRGWRWAVCGVALLVLGVVLAGGGGTTRAGGTTRLYQVATAEMAIYTVPPYSSPAPRFSWVIERAGTIRSIGIAPTTDVRASMEDRVVGSVWVNGSYTGALDDVFCVCSDTPAMHLTTLTEIGLPTTSELPVAAGDVVTVLLYDEGTGAPPLPPATWTLGVEE